MTRIYAHIRNVTFGLGVAAALGFGAHAARA